MIYNENVHEWVRARCTGFEYRWCRYISSVDTYEVTQTGQINKIFDM